MASGKINETHEDVKRGLRVIESTVRGPTCSVQVRGHVVQLVTSNQLPADQLTGIFRRADRRSAFEEVPLCGISSLSFCSKEADIEVDVVAHDDRLRAYCGQEAAQGGQYHVHCGSVCDVAVLQSRELYDKSRERLLRIHEGMEGVRYFAIFNPERAYLDDALAFWIQSCGFQIEDHTAVQRVLKIGGQGVVIHVRHPNCGRDKAVWVGAGCGVFRCQPQEYP